jgi:hypothetical protein
VSAPPVEPIIHVVGWLLVGEAATMTFPAMADALVGSPDWIAFILSAFVTTGMGGALVLASGGARPTSLSVRQTFLLTGTAERLGVRCWAGYDRPSFWLAGDQGWGGFCAWWKSGLKVPAEAST